ncbi:hypothetical protein [Methanobrevibacter boviskoreani]|uniref:hypothetical protein n=1 Tax=Methanobrevibacter boviskoreani TaxID=1348249 RepID=UPI0005934D77|nr:hypothetical protein [Methanobrevibacter boviskoreani]
MIELLKNNKNNLFKNNYNPFKNIFNDYKADNSSNYPTIIKTLKPYKLLNENEIKDFILKNLDIIQLINEVTELLKKYYPYYNYCMEFNIDSEIEEFNQIVIYVQVPNDLFNEEWGKLKSINKKIRNLKLYNDDIKQFLSIDLW